MLFGIELGAVAGGDQLFMSTVFIAGFLSFFAPCTFPMLPVYIGILTDHGGEKGLEIGPWTLRKRPFLKTLLFVAGISTTFITLGFGFGALGRLVDSNWFSVVSGLIVVGLGLHQMELFSLPGLGKYRVLRFKQTDPSSLFSAYILGLTFSFAWTPCVGPVLGAVLVVSADGGQALYGAFLMMLYALGLMMPFLGLTLVSEALMVRFQRLEAYVGKIKKIGGLLIVLMGLLILMDKINWITAWFYRIF